MRKINGQFVASPSERVRALSHARKMAREAVYDGNIEVWFDPDNGRFLYAECVGESYCASDTLQYVYSVPCRSWY